VCFVLEWQATPSALQPISTTLALAITAALIALLVFVIYKVWAGRNWARFLYVLIFFVGVYDAVEVFQVFSVVAVLTLGELLVQFVALYLVFLAPGNAWFRAQPPQEPRGA
jgi:heme A synthase